MKNNFDYEKFIEQYEQKEKETIDNINDMLQKNPMCLSCSQYFPGCIACKHTISI